MNLVAGTVEVRNGGDAFRHGGGADIQEEKVSKSGGVNLRYRTGWKGRWLQRFKDLLAARMPYCRVRYAF